MAGRVVGCGSDRYRSGGVAGIESTTALVDSGCYTGTAVVCSHARFINFAARAVTLHRPPLSSAEGLRARACYRPLTLTVTQTLTLTQRRNTEATNDITGACASFSFLSCHSKVHVRV